jgi:hypothetical protein
MSIVEMMATYASTTGLPPTGPHRKLADHLISRFSTLCQSCTGIGLQVVGGATRICAGCGGFRRVLSPSAIRRLHQIVGAHHPAVRKQDRRENAALWWAARKSVIPDGPIHLGLETVPAPVPRAPNDAARTVASITWRRGLHSEFLWSSSDTGHCVLWERLPRLELEDGRPWVEVLPGPPAAKKIQSTPSSASSTAVGPRRTQPTAGLRRSKRHRVAARSTHSRRTWPGS